MEIKKYINVSQLHLTWPIFIEMFFVKLMGITDIFMLSRYSNEAVAAVGFSNQILMLASVVFSIVATGSGVLMAQYLGAKENKIVSEVVMTSLLINLILGLFLGVIFLLFSVNILKILNIQVNLVGNASIYLKIVGGTSFLQAVLISLSATVRYHGLTKYSMYVNTGVILLNVIGDYLLISGNSIFPSMGVEGAAIAAAMSRMIGVIILFLILFKSVYDRIPFHALRSFKNMYINILKIGIPNAGDQVSFFLSQLVVTVLISMIGVDALATKVYIQQFILFISLFANSTGQGIQIMISQLIGKNRHDEAYKVSMTSLRLACFVSLLVACIFLLFSKQFLSIFTDRLSIINLGQSLLIITLLLEVGRAFNLILASSLRGAGDFRYPAVIGIFFAWGVSLPLCYFLGHYFQLGLVGIWIAFTIDEWSRGLLMLRRWLSNRWRDLSYIEKFSLRR